MLRAALAEAEREMRPGAREEEMPPRFRRVKAISVPKAGREAIKESGTAFTKRLSCCGMGGFFVAKRRRMRGFPAAVRQKTEMEVQL